MGVYGTLVLLQFIIVNLVDVSGIINSIKKGLGKWLGLKNPSLPMFECSYCMTHHTCVLWLLFTGNFTILNYAAVLLLCALTTVTKDIIYLVQDILTKVIQTLSDLLQ